MINGKNVSLGTVLWKILRQPIAADLSYEQAAEYALEFIRLIGAPLSFIDKVTKPPLELHDYKTAIPNDLIEVRGIRYKGTDPKTKEGIAMRYATDIYHMSIDENDNGETCSKEYTYVLQNCVITTSMKSGFIELSYKSILTDENGYPLVPDNESVKMGLEYYILHRHLEPLWTMGKIQDKVFQYYEQKRHFYVAQSENSLKIQGADHLESMMNGLNRLIVQTTSHETFYKNFGQKEYIRKYS